MKMKPLIDSDTLYSQSRYNDNTNGTHLLIKHSEKNQDKRDYASLAILSLMSTCGYIDEARSEIENETPEILINKLVSISTRMVEDSFDSERKL